MPTDINQMQNTILQLQRELWQLRGHLATRELFILDLAEQMQAMQNENKTGESEQSSEVQQE